MIVSFGELDFDHCERIVKKWVDASSSSEEQHNNKDKRSLQDLLFFLHVPRTGGRTYYNWCDLSLLPKTELKMISFDR